MPLAIGEASVWLIMIRRFACVCSMAKIAPLGRRLTESPDPLAIRRRSRSSRRGVVRISIDACDIRLPLARCGLPSIDRPAASVNGAAIRLEALGGPKTIFDPDNGRRAPG